MCLYWGFVEPSLQLPVNEELVSLQIIMYSILCPGTLRHIIDKKSCHHYLCGPIVNNQKAGKTVN